MKINTRELTRRQLLAAIAATSLGALAERGVADEPARVPRSGTETETRTVTLNALVSRNGQQTVTVPVSLDVS